MDEEFFFPQNVATSYTLMGLGPRHLRRAAWAGALGFAGAMFASVKGVPMPLSFLGATLLCAGYGVTNVWPIYAGSLTLFEQWQELRKHKQRQTFFPYRPTEEVDTGGSDPGGVAAYIRRIEATASPPGHGSGMA